MQKPPFKLAASMVGNPVVSARSGCCGAEHPGGGEDRSAERTRLAQLSPHFHCSVLGTCLSTSELRKIIARFVDVAGMDDLAIHNEAVGLANEGGLAAKALSKALDQRHEAALRQFSKARDPAGLQALWDDALRCGEIPGAYWALLTHRHVTPELRQKSFGDVHMLSHLVGAANRADIRRLVTLEKENQDLRERLERQLQRSQEEFSERDLERAHLQRSLIEAQSQLSATRAAMQDPGPDGGAPLARHIQADLVAVQTERRERAEQAAATAHAEMARLAQDVEHLQQHIRVLGRELSAAENQLREMAEGADSAKPALDAQLRGQRVLYVGGRPSSTPAIRSLVERHGGTFQRHDGGQEDRKGLLASAVSGSHLVVFPVDCVDHDSALHLKRLCTKLGIRYLPIRNASVASFAAGISARPDDAGRGRCLRS